jgi:uncharacterized protein
MLIHDMTRQASIELLMRARLCRLACAHEEQPYITPIHCVYDGNCLYSFSRLGQKVTWMRANPLVCVEAEELVSRQNWATVIVFGRYEELPDTPQYEAGRTHAYELLQRQPVWWEPGYLKTKLSDNVDPMEVVHFRIHVDQISGHRGVPDPVSGRELSAPVGWLRRILGRPEHKQG